MTRSVNAKKKVLIADDERLVRIGLRKTVDWQRWNMEVVAEAPNGNHAWEMYRLHRPDLVITDIVMPGMDGIELARKIRANDTKTQILFLSCHRDFAYAQQGIKLGVRGYILKTAMGDDEIEQYFSSLTADWERTAPPPRAKRKVTLTIGWSKEKPPQVCKRSWNNSYGSMEKKPSTRYITWTYQLR